MQVGGRKERTKDNKVVSNSERIRIAISIWQDWRGFCDLYGKLFRWKRATLPSGILKWKDFFFNTATWENCRLEQICVKDLGVIFLTSLVISLGIEPKRPRGHWDTKPEGKPRDLKQHALGEICVISNRDKVQSPCSTRLDVRFLQGFCCSSSYFFCAVDNPVSNTHVT